MTREELQSPILAAKLKAAGNRFQLDDSELEQFARVRSWLIRNRIQKADANSRTSQTLCEHVGDVLGEVVCSRVLGLALMSCGFYVYSIS